jgi:DNA modification methylase
MSARIGSSNCFCCGEPESRGGCVLGFRCGCMERRQCVAWTYNAHTPRKWRLISWFGIAPDFSRIKQPYRNPDDRRIVVKTDNGSEGANLYDWWHEEQVKNVSLEKTAHPCQIPLAVMNKIVGITPAEIIVDPFCGSGTTLRAAKDAGLKSIGIECDEKYAEISAKRVQQDVLWSVMQPELV